MNIDEYSALATRLLLLLVCHKDFLVVELGSAVLTQLSLTYTVKHHAFSVATSGQCLVWP